jgi:Xaa-Pro aminopeptidase
VTPDLILHADTERSATLRHEVALAIGDPFTWMRVGERTVVVTNALEEERLARVLGEDTELLLVDELGWRELLSDGVPRHEAEVIVVARAVERAGLRSAAVPPEFPLAFADGLRARGVELTVDAELFAARRRAKAPAELEGIRRAQRAAEAGMAAAAGVLRRAEAADGRLTLDGEPLTAEMVRAALRDATAAAGAPAPPDVMVTSALSGGGHDPGSGPLPAGLPITIDEWPQDEESACWADMTRTFVVGEVTPEVATLRDVALGALEAARSAVRPGAVTAELYDAACDVIEAAGHPTLRTREPGQTLRHGFYFGLGHGIGLEVHEAPSLGPSATDVLVPGDVIALEPGVENLPGIGGVRFEDLVLVTEDGFETLTDYPYDLAP